MAGLEGMKLGNYEVIQRIGGGGMGDIYLAEHPELRRRVAIKVVRGGGDDAHDPEADRRFANEARSVAALEHPHILPIYDYGEQDGIHYLVMQYVPEGSLADLLGSGPQHIFDLPVAPRVTARLVLQAAEALQYAHDRGVIHRDVKPHNLLVRLLSGARAEGAAAQVGPHGELDVERFHVLLADFGLARFMTELTGRTGTTGTPLYTAPEQYHGRPGPGSDQYSLACVAYLLLAGRPVFDGTVVELHHQHLAVRPSSIAKVNSRLGAAVDAVLQRALEKDPQARFPAVLDFGRALADSLVASVGSAAGEGVPFGVSAAPSVPFMPAAPAAPPAQQLVPFMPPGPFTAPPAPMMAPPSTPLAGGMQPPVPGQGVPRFPALPAGAAVTGESSSGTTPSDMPWATPQASTPYPMNAATQPGGPPALGGALPLQAASPGSPSPSPWPAQPAGRGTLSPLAQPGSAAGPSTPLSAPYGSYGSGGAVSAGRRHEPDAPGAPVPKPVSKRRRRWDRLPLRRKLAYIGAALSVVLAVALSAAYVVTHRPQPPQAKTVAFGKVARTGSVDVSRLTDLSTAGISPKGQASQPVFPLHPGQGTSASADHNTSLAPMAATIPDSIPDGARRALESKAGLEQGGVDPGGVGLPSPMDVSLGASDQYVVEAVDGAFQVFGYNGQADGPEVAASDFFAPVLQSGDLLGEPHVLFDQPSQRWVIVANETKTDDSGVSGSYFDVAISQDAQPVTVWSLYQISTQEGEPAGCTWADDPRLGSDATALYLTGNSYGCGGDASFRGAMLWALPKKTFLTGKATQFLRWSGLFTNTQHQPVFSLVPAVQPGNASTEWLMSDDAGYASGGKTSKQVLVYAVLNPQVMEQGQIPSLVGVYVGLQLPYADPPSAMQSGSPNAITTGDARIASLIGAGGHLYAAFTTAVNWQGDKATRSGIYWLDLIPQVVPGSSGGTSGTATTSDSARLAVKVSQANIFGFAGGYTYYPALAADANGDVALLAGAASPGITPSLILGWRHAGDPVGTMGAAGKTVWLQHGAPNAPYTGSHWGDYSGAWMAPGSAGGRPSLWLAGPYMTNYPSRWQTLVWQMPI